MNLKQFFRSKLESVLGVRAFKYPWLPHGTSLEADLERWVGRTNLKTVFDVGAHHGDFALELSRSFPQATIYAFEPFPESHKILSSLNIPRVVPVNKAVGAESGRLPLNVKEGTTGCSLVNSAGTVDTVDVDLITLDEFAEAEGLSRVDLLKLDVEGFELEALKGARRQLEEGSIAFLYAETELVKSDHHFVAFADLVEVLGKFGYECGGIYDQQCHWTKKRSLYYVNALFISPKFVSRDKGL